MDGRMRQAVDQSIAQMYEQVKAWAEQAERMDDPASAEALERRIREEGLRALAATQEHLMQARLDQRLEADRTCPECGARRRHKGRQGRELLGVLGPIRLEPVQWRCPGCGSGGSSLRRLAPHRISGPMRGLLTMVGTAWGGFAKAARACSALVGVKVSKNTIHRLCLAEGQQAMERMPALPAESARQPLIGSCDGTMVHTREDGWRELKACQFQRAERYCGEARLEAAEAFVPRLAGWAKRLGHDPMRPENAPPPAPFSFVSDAAMWINQGVAEYLPDATHIHDLWHTRQHIHEAAAELHGEATESARRWAERWGRRLWQHGGHETARRLRSTLWRYPSPDQAEAVRKLIDYLQRHAEHLDYPRYQRDGRPTSSGPMESYCKQLGQRLKGPGMRWARASVEPMAALTTLWAQDRWDEHWAEAA